MKMIFSLLLVVSAALVARANPSTSPSNNVSDETVLLPAVVVTAEREPELKVTIDPETLNVNPLVRVETDRMLKRATRRLALDLRNARFAPRFRTFGSGA